MQPIESKSLLEDGFEEDDDAESTSSSLQQEEAPEPVTLEKNCYSLVIVGTRNGSQLGGRTALCFVALNSICQVVVIYVLSRSPEYYFGNGGWLLPISDTLSTNAVKTFAVVLSLFQVTQEMEDVSTMFRVLTHKPWVDSILKKHKIQCSVALLMQYIFALTVCVVSMQMVCSRQRPIDCLWVNYYVFMTLSFDNMLCRFLLFLFGAQDWDFVLAGATNKKERGWNRRCKFFNRFLFLHVPILITAVIGAFAVKVNICPLTWYYYGYVSNEEPVLMMPSSLGLPQSCCPVWTAWSQNHTGAGHLIPVAASVPVLSSTAPEEHIYPELYWVISPTRKMPPNSLQIMDGRGGDGLLAEFYGKVNTTPNQMRVWLQKHNYEPGPVYASMMNRKAGIKLYVTRFSYLGEWNITHVPWSDRTRIYATARNPVTGALSPVPVSSQVLVREVCAPHCRRCNPDGKCTHCEDGFKLAEEICEPCAEYCQVCNKAGQGACDRGGCRKGYGIHRAAVSKDSAYFRDYGVQKVLDLCFPCKSGLNCSSCDEDIQLELGLDKASGPEPGGAGGAGKKEGPKVRELPCKTCAGEFGLSFGHCGSCEIAHCHKCSESLQDCTKCRPFFTIFQGDAGAHVCEPCLPNCTKCDEKGPGQCDPLRCEQGFTYGKESIGDWRDECVRCAPNCLHCDVAGHNGCNEGGCKDGYTRWPLQGLKGACQACSPHCRNCTLGNQCDRGHCEHGFGLQGGSQCSRCAEDSCKTCDVSWSQCDECAEGYGFSSMHTCRKCPSHCATCANMDRCTKCEKGFELTEGQCLACADQCRSCTESGEGFCDEGQCEDGWTTVKLDNTSRGPTCRPCHDPRCRRCDSRGPDHCDVGTGLTPEPTSMPQRTVTLPIGGVAA